MTTFFALFSFPFTVQQTFFLIHLNFPLQQKKKATSEEILQLSQEAQYKTDELILGLK